jgi:uncharacterized protein
LSRETEKALMAQMPTLIGGKRVAVAGVSRGSGSAANRVYRKLRSCGYEVFSVNPTASEVEGAKCYRDLASIPGDLDGVVITTHPDVSAQIVWQAVDRQVGRIWFHRSFGDGSVSATAVQECAREGIPCIVGGCPLMYCEPVDFLASLHARVAWLARTASTMRRHNST